MSKVMKVGAIVKLNNELFKNGWKPDGHFGDLGYPGIMRDWAFKVLDNIPHDYHGDTVLCVPINVVGAEGELRLLTKDLQPAVMKRTVEYTFIDNSDEIARINSEIKQLELSRKSIIETGRFKPTGRTLKANQNLIDEAKMRLSQAKSGEVKIFLPKIKKTVTVSSELSKNKDELEMLLASEISSFRAANKVSDKIETKMISGVAVTKVNGVYNKPNTFGEIFETKLATLIKSNKNPSAADANYLGIEIECIHLCSRAKLEELFCKVRLHNHVQLVGDSSIQVDQGGYNASEIRILVKEDELEDVMTKIGKVLSMRTVDAYANRSCGLHVHLDARNRDVESMYSNLFNVQALLRKSQPQARIVSTYCKENKDATYKACKRGDNERYSVINTHAYEKQKSLEVRVHEGTTNTQDITNWCKFLMSVVNKDLTITKVVNSPSELKTIAPSVPTDYIEARIARYGDDTLSA